MKGFFRSDPVDCWESIFML